MSLHHLVTIHCDVCGWWIHGEGVPTAKRRREGWLIGQTENGGWRHVCPKCSSEGRTLDDVA